MSTASSYASAARKVKPTTSRVAFSTVLSRPARHRARAFIWGTDADLGGAELLRMRHAPPMRQLQERGMLFVGTSVDRRDEWATLPCIRRVIRSSRQSGLATTLIPLSGIRQGHGFLG
jgi:hypothetical protein